MSADGADLLRSDVGVAPPELSRPEARQWVRFSQDVDLAPLPTLFVKAMNKEDMSGAGIPVRSLVVFPTVISTLRWRCPRKTIAVSGPHNPFRNRYAFRTAFAIPEIILRSQAVSPDCAYLKFFCRTRLRFSSARTVASALWPCSPPASGGHSGGSARGIFHTALSSRP